MIKGASCVYPRMCVQANVISARPHTLIPLSCLADFALQGGPALDHLPGLTGEDLHLIASAALRCIQRLIGEMQQVGERFLRAFR